jgi:hypothetical protein
MANNTAYLFNNSTNINTFNVILIADAIVFTHFKIISSDMKITYQIQVNSPTNLTLDNNCSLIDSFYDVFCTATSTPIGATINYLILL